MRQTVNILLTVSLLNLLVAACTSETDEPVAPSEEQAIAFSAGTNQTRAYSPMESTGRHNTFGVWSTKYKDGAASNVLLHNDACTPYMVYYTNQNTWRYDGYRYSATTTFNTQYIHYWDASATRYVFGAFSPWNPMITVADKPLDLIQTFKNAHPESTSEGWMVAVNRLGNYIAMRTKGAKAGTFLITGVTGHRQDASDWVLANHTRHITSPQDEDMLAADDDNQKYGTPNAYYSAVPLHFHPIMAHIEFRIYNEAERTVNLTGLQILTDDDTPFYTKGDYDGKLGSSYDDIADWTSTPYESSKTTVIANHSDNYLFTVTGYTKETATRTTSSSYPEVPQWFTGIDPEDATKKRMGIKVGLRFEEQDVWEWSDMNYVEGGWMPGTKYIYYIKINERDEKIILIDIDVDMFQWRQGNDLPEEEFTNW